MAASTCADSGVSNAKLPLNLWSVWGHGLRNQVFTDAFFMGQRVIFRFVNDPMLPKSLQSRIVNCVHEKPGANASETFVNQETMRQVVLTSVTKAWDSCSNHPCISMRDVVVEVYEAEVGRLQWRLSHLDVYEGFVRHLLPLQVVLYEEMRLNVFESYETVSFLHLKFHGGFEGRGNVLLVSLNSDPNTLFVFKGLDLAMYLITDHMFRHRMHEFYHEVQTIRSLRSYPNIISKDMKFVMTTVVSREPRSLCLCGTLYPYMKNGSLKDVINRAIDANIRLELGEKAKWCYQMVSAIAHTHFMDRTYHMDIRPSNFLVDDNRDLILIDWEQSRAARCTIAPEAVGSHDATIQRDGNQTKLIYTEYEGPQRINNPFSWPEWNVFPIWRDVCFEALDAAEVYSLGRTMWMLLEQVNEGNPDKVAMKYWENARDVPSAWKAVVDRCLESDPNERIQLQDLMTFWEKRPL